MLGNQKRPTVCYVGDTNVGDQKDYITLSCAEPIDISFCLMSDGAE